MIMGKNRKGNQGYVTLFTCLLLMVMLVFILFVLEVIYRQMGEVKAKTAVTANIKSCFGDYAPDIYRDYHLLMLDIGYGSGSTASMEERLLNQLNENLGGGKGLFRLTAEDIVLKNAVGVMDNHCAALQKQIHEYCGYAMAESLLDMLKNRDGQEDAKEPEEKETDKKTVSAKKVKDPRGMLSGLTGEALLTLVCPQGRMPSAKVLSLAGLPTEKANIAGENDAVQIDFFHGNGLEELLSAPSVDLDSVSYSAGRIEVAFYIRSCFRTFLEEEKEQESVLSDEQEPVFAAEQEYILYGNDTDRQNVLKAVQGIVLLRLPFNYLYLKSSVSKKVVLSAAAVTIGLLTGTPPGVVEFLLTGGAAYAEGVLDVKALLCGERVPLKKSEDTWRLSLTAFLKGKLKGKTVQAGDRGLSYQDYLTLLALIKGKEEALYYRILDVITLKVRQERQAFTMDTMITGAVFQYHITEAPRFSAIPAHLSPEAYQFFYERELSY